LSLALTNKEIEVMELLLQGKLDREIGAALGLKRRTVRERVGRACDKLGALTRAQAAVLYDRARRF